MSASSSIVAYDYDAHRWESGARAVMLRRSQLRQEIATFQSPEGEGYASFLGVNRFVALDLLQDALRELERRTR